MLSRRGQLASRLKTKPSLAGNGLLERMRSTTFALLGITAAMGLGLVALVSQQGWPYLPALPIPAAPPEHAAVHDARVVTPSLIASGPLEFHTGTSGSAQFAGFGGVKGPVIQARGSSHLSGSHQVGGRAVSPPSPGEGQSAGEGTAEPAPPSQPVSEAPAPTPAPTATPVSAPNPASTSTPAPATVAPSTSGAAPPVSSSSGDDQDHSSAQGHSYGQSHSSEQGHSYGQSHSSEQGHSYGQSHSYEHGHSYPQGGGYPGGRETAHQHWSHPPTPAPQPPVAAAAPEPVPTQPAAPSVESPERYGGRGYGSHGQGHGFFGHDR
jgi:hypothetical protein